MTMFTLEGRAYDSRVVGAIHSKRIFGVVMPDGSQIRRWAWGFISFRRLARDYRFTDDGRHQDIEDHKRVKHALRRCQVAERDIETTIRRHIRNTAHCYFVLGLRAATIVQCEQRLSRSDGAYSLHGFFFRGGPSKGIVASSHPIALSNRKVAFDE
jgi:hypothetical protein